MISLHPDGDLQFSALVSRNPAAIQRPGRDARGIIRTASRQAAAQGLFQYYPEIACGARVDACKKNFFFIFFLLDNIV